MKSAALMSREGEKTMFNKDVKPIQPEPNEPPPRRDAPERPKREEVSPSQEGKFQRELERKEEKKEEKPAVPAGSEKKSLEKGEKGLFHLSREGKQGEGKGGKKEMGQQKGQQQPSATPTQPTTRAQPISKEGEEVIALSGVPVEETPEIVSHIPEEGEEVGEPIAIETEEGIPLTAEKGRETPIIPTGREAEAPVQPTQLPGEAVVRPEITPEAREAHRAELHALVEQVAETMATLVSKTDTTIVVTLKHPPLFDGASLIVKESATAKNEYNITFENLSPQARALIDVEANQAQLRQGLIEKGYTLHMVTVEPGVLYVTPAEAESRPGEGRSFEQGGGGQTGEGEGGEAEEREGRES
jgi:hypothetical protein